MTVSVSAPVSVSVSAPVCVITAFYADRGGAKVLLAEKGDKLGGVIQTQQGDEAQWEEGPNTFQASAKGMLRLVAGNMPCLRILVTQL